MPESWFNAHWEQGNRNLALFNNLHPNTGFHDWKVTILFYAGLHFTHARVADALTDSIYNHQIQSKDRYLTTHTYFLKLLNQLNLEKKNEKFYKTVSNFNQIELPSDEYTAYKALYTLSRKARYMESFDPSAYPHNQFTTGFINRSEWINTTELKFALKHTRKLLDFIKQHHPSQPLTPLNVP